jgi:5-methylcytosine-specific restriction endonuclease McrA
MKQTLFVVFAFLISISFSTIPVYSHGGRTDANGGHNDRKRGGYHYHNKKTPSSKKRTYKAPSSNTKSYSKKTSTQDYDSPQYKNVSNYFRHSNENVGAFDCNLKKYKRNVSAKTKRYIIERDGGSCVICGSTYKLEVDHRRALMNGGNNSYANLATLCDDCHNDKTRMDNSIRRKRNKMCKGK